MGNAKTGTSGWVAVVWLVLAGTPFGMACGADPGAPPSTSPGRDGGMGEYPEDSAASLDRTDAMLPVDAATPPPARLTDDAAYLVTVITENWGASEGQLRRYRRGVDGWVRDGAAVPIILGRSGVGWGRGVHGEGAVADEDGPVKREGDGRSPAGAFWLDRALGYAPDAPEGTEITYQAMTPTLQCIEDVESAYYNRVVDRALTTPDWDSTDRLLRDDGLYEYLVFVDQNTDPAPVPGRGSCILLHVWSSPTSPTAGCTSMQRDALREVVRSLAPEDNLLVQLPGPVYSRLEAAWGLPPAD